MPKDQIKRASEFLLQGATMLQIACPECHNAIYKMKDQSMHCAFCNKQVLLERNMTVSQKKELNQETNPIYQKIEKLKLQLEKEEDPDTIIKIAETIKKLQDIL